MALLSSISPAKRSLCNWEVGSWAFLFSADCVVMTAAESLQRREEVCNTLVVSFNGWVIQVLHHCTFAGLAALWAMPVVPRPATCGMHVYAFCSSIMSSFFFREVTRSYLSYS